MFPKIGGKPPKWMVKIMVQNPNLTWMIWRVKSHIFGSTPICAMVKSRYIGDGHPTFNRNPYNWYKKPYYWVDDHPPLYGNIGSLAMAHIEALAKKQPLKVMDRCFFQKKTASRTPPLRGFTWYFLNGTVDG